MRKTIYLFTLGLVVVILATLAGAGLVVSAQNANSSMTMTETAKAKPRKPKTKKTSTGRCDPMKHEQTDLSGTYTGKVRHDKEPAQEATLTITGNNFTMTSGSETHSGRITAVTTCGYTGVTMMMGDLTPPAPGPNPPPALPAMSLRAKKVGNSLTLTSVPGEPKQVWFSTSGSGTPKKRKHTAKTKKSAPEAPAKTTP
ncbi:MAG TPA: hypothetical protein VHQ95_16725 [Pyrinomonadaceae bacterium]|nr:hypothetical protein [Pyrinomonadaceae bacterium]HWP54776.1 hypothetical protein [Pyrinomonadaceae bacterium]